MRRIVRKGGVVNRTALGAAALLADVVVITTGYNKKTEELTGDTQLAENTSMEEICVAIEEAFMEEEPGIAVFAEYIDSTAGMEALLEETADIGTSSGSLTQEELEKGAVENIMTRDGIAVILSRGMIGIEDLTSDELRDAFCGRAANWNGLGGPNTPVAVTGRRAGSGIRSPFEEILGIVDQYRYTNELSGSGTILTRTAATQGAVGYISIVLLDDTVWAMSAEGVQPTRKSIQDGGCSLNKTMVAAAMGAIEKQNPLVQRYFEFVYSDQGQSLADGANLALVPREQRESGKSVAC